jgi:hypothetical protein
MHSLVKGNHKRVQGYHLLMIRQNARTIDISSKTSWRHGTDNQVSDTVRQQWVKKFELMSGNLTTGTSKHMSMMKQMVLILFCDIFGHSCNYIQMHVLYSNYTSPDQVWTTTQDTYVTTVWPPVIN